MQRGWVGGGGGGGAQHPLDIFLSVVCTCPIEPLVNMHVSATLKRSSYI